MAQDLIALRPDALILTPSGFYKVDYDKLDIRMHVLEQPSARAA